VEGKEFSVFFSTSQWRNYLAKQFFVHLSFHTPLGNLLLFNAKQELFVANKKRSAGKKNFEEFSISEKGKKERKLPLIQNIHVSKLSTF
jgi:hypothetical protein